MNKYDSNKILSYLFKSSNKYILVSDLFKSDVIILNTCSVRQKAQDKLFNYLNKIESIKINNPNLIVAVGGCIATQEKGKLFSKNKIIDIIFGTQNIKDISYLINYFIKNKKKIIKINFNNNINKNINNLYIDKKYINNTYVSIMEGCDKFCSYCIVPYTRGRQISRTPMSIISEICYLSSKGICEVNLLGQNVSAYSSFLSNGKKCDFSCLLNLISEIDNIKRIKFTTSHPNDFNKDIISCYKNNSKIVDYLHLPVQSGSDRILKMMKRNYTIESYKKIIYDLLLIRPNMIFGSDFIVGFPSENDNDFKLTLNLINEIKFDNSYAFLYSPRKGTRSYEIKDNTSLLIKKQRLYKIQNLLYNNSIYWSKKMLNTKQEVLVEGITKKNNFYYGRSLNNKIIYFKSINNNSLIGKIINILVLYNKNSSLYGKIYYN